MKLNSPLMVNRGSFHVLCAREEQMSLQLMAFSRSVESSLSLSPYAINQTVGLLLFSIASSTCFIHKAEMAANFHPLALESSSNMARRGKHPVREGQQLRRDAVLPSVREELPPPGSQEHLITLQAYDVAFRKVYKRYEEVIRSRDSSPAYLKYREGQISHKKPEKCGERKWPDSLEEAYWRGIPYTTLLSSFYMSNSAQRVSFSLPWEDRAGPPVEKTRKTAATRSLCIIFD